MSNVPLPPGKAAPGFLRVIDAEFRLVASARGSRSPCVDARPAPSSRFARVLPWAVLAGLWLASARTLGAEWAAAPQYHYGWAVPVLCGWLFWQRWQDRPVPHPTRAPAWFGLILALGFAPLRLVLETFPDWRPALWLLAAILVGTTFWLLRAAGGKAWTGHFAFPVAFLLTAVPWPTPLEATVIHGLMRANAALAADVVTALGTPAVQRGAVIDLGSTLVGVDEACSGIRSLQASLMLALLFGEVFRVSMARRVGLLGIGLLLALSANLARTGWLVWTAAHDGAGAAGAQHDQTGWLSLLACVSGVALLGWRWRRSPLPRAEPDRRTIEHFPAAAWIGVLAVLTLAESGTELWFRRHDAGRAVSTNPGHDRHLAETLRWPTARSGYRQLGIRPAVKAVLGSDHEAAAAWRDSGGARLVVHLLRWEPRPVREAMLAKYHTPDVCLPAAGCLPRGELPTATIDTAFGPLPFRGYLFEEEGRPLHVYYLLIEDRDLAAGTSGPVLTRLRLVRDGVRHTGQTVLHVAIRDAGDDREAETILRRELAVLGIGSG